MAACLFLVTGCAPPAPGSVQPEEVIEDAQYYYACGNEVLVLDDGRVFYPLLREDQETFDTEPYAAGAIVSVDRFAAVMPPGPGDDTGTLTIYEDGMAHWVSDSGTEAWLTTETIEYNWMC